MRYALPVTGGSLAAHFGHCEEFAFFDVDDSSGNIVAVEFVPSPGHQPGFLPVWLAEQGASAIIAGGMGPRAVELFESNRVEVILGAPEGDPEQVMISYLAGTMEAGENVCNHEQGDHSC
ncbi:MAG: NifB/NifX family molybdenum-iron cluster-binding protein [Dehalococcoidia bacterium]|nr:NifB/NifX family molybdenum-iron cluster-binding protein [Dehalococcoidia bacterium]